jgi:hypothetical protein
MGKLNDLTSAIHIAGNCDVRALQELVSPETLLVMDCEGCEVSLLDLGAAPSLSTTTILVELHDFIVSDATATIVKRFGDSHDIRLVSTQKRSYAEYPELSNLTPVDGSRALDEGRPCEMTWAIMIPLT